MKTKRSAILRAAGLLALAGLLAASGCLTRPPAPQAPAPAAQVPAASEPATAAAVDEASEPIPRDPRASVGRLDNGLSFYVLANRWPEKRAELRLVVNAGSVLEDDDQLGLAHFVEHMAFDGTESFHRQQIIDYMESIGMRFGPEVNAYTSFDETVYRLTVPTDDPKILQTGVQILEEWAHRLLFDPAEVDRERGVIVEEWRLGRGAEARMADRQWPILYQGSRYAERLPIGKPEVIRAAPVEALRRFYRDWYRPDLMAVVAVGDFDPAWMQSLIRERFSGWKGPEAPRPRPLFPVPDHGQTLYAPATDPEATRSVVVLQVNHAVPLFRTVGDYRRELARALFNSMLNGRFDELTRQPDSAIQFGFSGLSREVRSSEGYLLGAGARNDRIRDALEVLLTEMERARRYGFTGSELARNKERLLAAIESAYRERDRTESEDLARSFVGNFLEGEPIPSIEQEYELYRRLVPLVGLEEVNRLAGELLSEGNRVVRISAPEKARGGVPVEPQVLALFQEVRANPLEPYRDRTAGQPLFGQELPETRIVSRREVPELGLSEWKLANGARVVLKPTRFKEDQVLFTAFSPGGTSLVPDKEYIAALTASRVVSEGGVDGLDAVELKKKLAGKVVSVSPYIGELYEGLNGSGRPEDLETLFQLIYLYATEPRQDPAAYRAFQERLRETVKNRQDSPDAVFADRVQTVLAQNHFRARPWSPELVQEMSLEESLDVYRERFKDAGDFTFLFVGSFTLQQIEPLVTRYLGGLPTSGRVESWHDTGMRPPKGVVRAEVRKGLEPKSKVVFVFNGETEWSLGRSMELQALAEVLDIRLREAVRDEAGGSYDIAAAAELNHYPRPEYFISVDFGCAPDQVERLSAIVLAQVERMRARGPEPGDLAKVKEILRREHEQNLQDNGWWLGSLQTAYGNGLNPRVLLDFGRRLDSLSVDSLKRTAVALLRPDNYVRVDLLPER
jgi:zinc protease